MKALYILTDKEKPNLHHDDSNLLEALQKLDIKGHPVVWDETEIKENSTYLMRTPWDYPLKRERFEKLLDDIDQKKSQMINSTDIIRWNLNKSYMLELISREIPTVPTMIVNKFQLDDFQTKDYPIVAKPLVGASGRDTFLIQTKEDLKKCTPLIGKSVIVQPFVPSIQTEGEYSFILFEGTFSHAVQKCAKQGEFRIQEEHGGTVKTHTPTPEEITYVENLVEKLYKEFIYARVDLVRFENELQVMELEVIEPELFLRHSDQGTKLFAEAISRKLLEVEN